MSELTPSELLQLHEMAVACSNQTEKASAYLAFVQDPELESLVRNYRQKTAAHYEELIDLGRGAPTSRQFESMDGGLSGRRTKAPRERVNPLRPERQTGFEDRTVASDLLQSSKMMAVRGIWAATELSHVGLRRALSEMSRYYLDAAYEMYRYNEQQGWYTPLAAGERASSWFRDTHEPTRQETMDSTYS
jgi:spore coat protein CotF